MADVKVISPDGTPGTVSAEEAREALAQGYELDTPELQAKRADEEKYGGGVLNPIAAFGEAALRAPTFGASDYVEEALGVPREDIAGRAEHNPTANVLGTGAGIVGGVATGGALGAPMAATATAGKTAGAIARKLLTGIGGKAVAGLGEAATDFAAQSAVYNAFQKIDETHLAGGDLKTGVENALASTRDALKFGAVGGALLHGLGTGVRSVAGKAKQALGKLDSTLAEMNGQVDQFAKAQSEANVAAGEEITKPEDVKNLFEKIGTEEGAASRATIGTDKFVTPEARNDLGNRFNDAIGDARTTMDSVRKQAFERIRPEEIAEMLKELPPPTEAAHGLADLMRKEVAGLVEDGAPKALFSKLSSAADKYETNILGATTAAETYDAILSAKRDLGKKLEKWRNTIDPEQAEHVERALGVERALKDNLRNSELWGPNAAAQAALDDAYAAQKASDKFLFGYKVKGGGAKAGKLTVKVPNRAGKFDLELNTKATNTVISQIGEDVARSSQTAQALQAYRDSSHDLIDAVAKAAKTTGADFDKAGMKSLLDRFQEVSDEAAKKLGTESIYRQAARADDIGYNMFPKVAERMMKAVEEVPVVGKLAGAGFESIASGVETAKAARGLAGFGNAAQPARTAEELMAMARTLSKLEGFNLKTSRRIESGLNSFLSGAAKTKKFSEPILAYVTGKAVPYQKELDDKARAYHDQAFTSQLFHEHLQTARGDDDMPSPLATHAPMMAIGIGEKQAEIAQYLWNLYPKDASPVLGLDGGKFSKFKPSKQAMVEYRQAEQVARDPLIVLDKMGKGLLSSRDVKIVGDLWPKALEQMRQKAMERAAAAKQPPTRSQKQQLLVLIGQPMYDTQDPVLGQIAKKSFAAQNEAKKAVAQQAAKGLSRLSEESKTASQRLVK